MPSDKRTIPVPTRRRTRRTCRYIVGTPHPSAGWTLVEALCLLAIVGVSIAFILPVLSRSRSNGWEVTCLANMRVLTKAALEYSNDFDGKFFYHWEWRGDLPYTDDVPEIAKDWPPGWWYDSKRIGPYLPEVNSIPKRDLGDAEPKPKEGLRLRELVDGPMTCPARSPETRRGYSFNSWAAGIGGGKDFQYPWDKLLDDEFDQRWGQLFDSNAKNLDRLLLFGETMPWLDLTYYRLDPFAHGVIGSKFGGPNRPPSFVMGGTYNLYGNYPKVEYPPPLAPLYPHGPAGHKLLKMPAWEFYFAIHEGEEPLDSEKGTPSFGFADGHAESLSRNEIFDVTTMRSTYRAMISPIDRGVDDQFFEGRKIRKNRLEVFDPNQEQLFTAPY